MSSGGVVVLVASAGGVEALKRVTSELPGDLPACVVVALHLPPTGESLLPSILARRSPLRVVGARDGMPLEPGTLVAAPPGWHLIVDSDVLRLGPGAAENGHRPSHDVLLRSAALAHGPRVVAAVLTGLLDDGAAGLAAVDRYGGTCLVQADAEFTSMPRHALAAVPSAREVPLADLAREVVRAVTDPPAETPQVPPELRLVDLAELESARGRPPVVDGVGVGSPSPFACPDCHGVLNGVEDDNVVRFRCRTGHAWSASSLLAQQHTDVQAALWTALRVLEERAELVDRLAETAAGGSRGWSSQHFRSRADEARQAADRIRGLLSEEARSDSDDASTPAPSAAASAP